MRAVISVANVARGVGKSTTAVSLAAELALRGFETLLVDADAQAEATALLVAPDSVRLSVADLVLAPEPRYGVRGEGPRFGLGEVLVLDTSPRNWSSLSVRISARQQPIEPKEGP